MSRFFSLTEIPPLSYSHSGRLAALLAPPWLRPFCLYLTETLVLLSLRAGGCGSVVHGKATEISARVSFFFFFSFPSLYCIYFSSRAAHGSKAKARTMTMLGRLWTVFCLRVCFYASTGLAQSAREGKWWETKKRGERKFPRRGERRSHERRASVETERCYWMRARLLTGTEALASARARSHAVSDSNKLEIRCCGVALMRVWILENLH